MFALHSGSFRGSLYLRTGAHWGLVQEQHEAQCLAQSCFQNLQQVVHVPMHAPELDTACLAVGLAFKPGFTPLRRGRFFCSPAHPTPPARHLKPDLIPLHAGNLLVYWAFLGGKLHCLYSRVQAAEAYRIPKAPFSGPGPHTPSARSKISFIGLLCHANKAVIIRLFFSKIGLD